MRYPSITLRLPLLPLLLLAAGAAGQAPPAHFACSVDGRPMPPMPPAFFGVCSKELHADSPLLGAVAQQMAATGAVAVGSKIHWERLEAVQGVWAWPRYDPQLDTFDAQGLTPVVVLRGTPSWASPFPFAPRPERFPPTNLAHWEDFVRAAVRRYGSPGLDLVRRWEIWNEPNEPGFFLGTREEYTVLLTSAYAVIKTEDPAARVWAPTLAFHPWATTAWEWAQQVIDHGVFDVFSIHLYFASPAEMVAVVEEVRARLDAAGHAAVPIAVTEINDLATVTDCSGYSARSELRQARQLVDVHACLANAGVDSVLWFKSSDLGQCCPPPDDERPNRNGLLDERAQPKLRYHWYRALVAAQQQRSPLFFAGSFEAGDTAAWQAASGP